MATKKQTTQAAPFEYEAYKESDAVSQAKAALDAQLALKPGAYQSGWTQSLKDTIDKINNREKFSYDINGDALYQQYKDQYTTQGKQAMMDTMGQAAALTGGYGNSYAQSVGQQTYQGYLQQLNERVPELYQLALDQYNREGEDLYRKYALYGEQESMDYNRYRDTVSDYNAERDRLQNQYNTERDYDYSKYTNNRDFAYQGYADRIAQEQWQAQFNEAMRQYNESFAYQKERDRIADEQWQAQFDMAAAKAAVGSSGGYKEKEEEEDDIDPKEKKYSPNPMFGQNTSTPAFTGNTYSEAIAYIKQYGKAGLVTDILTNSEWNRMRASYLKTGQGIAEVTKNNSYSDYLKTITKYAVNG